MTMVVLFFLLGRSKDLLQRSVLYPFLVILVLMFLLQFSGQGAITFYTAMIFEESECIVAPKNCAIIVGYLRRLHQLSTK